MTPWWVCYHLGNSRRSSARSSSNFKDPLPSKLLQRAATVVPTESNSHPTTHGLLS